jgi:organic radical activating enzyme
MPKCLAFDHAITIGPGGNVRPCCVWQDHPGTPSLKYWDDWKSRHDQWGKLQEQGWLPQCRGCKNYEDQGQGSYRTSLNRLLENAQGIAYWDLKINNTCTLACRMCDSWSSSKWEQYADTPGIMQMYLIPQDNRWHRESMDILAEMIDAKVVKFTGGEPLLIPQVRKIVQQLVDDDIAPAIELHLVSNGMQDFTDWLPLFEKFKHVRITVSIDALGDRYEYIRPHASWSQVEHNVLELSENRTDNMVIVIACLHMVLNRDHMHQVKSWAHSNGFLFQPDIIMHPVWLKPDVMQDSINRPVFIEQMEIMDSLHGTNWRDFVNE